MIKPKNDQFVDVLSFFTSYHDAHEVFKNQLQSKAHCEDYESEMDQVKCL